MQIGVDATCWHNDRGYGRHARALLSALLRLDTDNRYTFFSDHPLTGEPFPGNVDLCQVCASRPTVEAASAQGNRSPRDMWRMSRAMGHRPLDVLLFPTVYSYVPVWSRARKIVMIHDVIAERFPELTLPRRTARWFWQTKVALARWQADMIVTVSEHARQTIVEHFRLPAEQVRVVGEASDPVFRPLPPEQRQSARLAKLGLLDGARQLVYLGGFNPHKNLEMLVDVFAELIRDPALADLRMVMVGSTESRVFHSYIDAVRDRIAALALQDRVVFTGFLTDDELVCLLNGATVLALPSLLEGFGLPAVEAAACGCPVVATSESPLPELLGNGGLFVHPHDRKGWHRALAKVLADEPLRQQMGQVGVQAARSLTWAAAARQMFALLQQLAPSADRRPGAA